MADSDPTPQKIHFDHDVNPVKLTGYSIAYKASPSDKVDDLEADHKRFADEDRNRKKKQASAAPSYYLSN